MKTTGQILKDAREKKGISINEVALATKINAKALIAMEAGDADGLPPKTFLRGFVRAYAAFLGLDVDQTLATYHQEMGPTKPVEEGGPAEGGARSGLDRRRGARRNEDLSFEGKGASRAKIGGVVVVLILIALIVLFKKKMDSYEAETVAATGLATPAPGVTPAPVVAPLPTAAPEATPAPTPDAAATPAATPQPSPAPTPAPTPQPSPAATPAPTSTPAPTPQPTPKATATPEPAASPSPSPSPSPTPRPTPVGKPQEVLIEALDAVEIDATVDGEATRKLKLKGQEVQTIKAKKRVILRFSDGGAVNLVVNGKDRGVPGDLGKPMRVELP